MFQTIKNLLSDRMRQQGLAEAIEAAQVTEAFKQEVVKRFGQSSADSFRRLVLQGDTLEVQLTSSAFASELKMAEFDLRDALQARFNGRIYRLRIFG